MTIKDGKKPITQKQEKKPFKFEKLSMLDVPSELKKELSEQGLEYRWINAPRLRGQQGFNKNYWKPYKVNYDKIGIDNFFRSPDGYLVRGDVILAVRPKDIGDAHKARLKSKADRLKASIPNRGQDEISSTHKKAGL